MKLGLLFLTRADVNLPLLWSEFLNEAGSEVRSYCHPKQVVLPPGSLLEKCVVPNLQPTAWGDVSLVRAMLSLLREGMKAEDLTHFVFLSESCIPIKPWHVIREALRNDPRSMIRWRNEQEMAPIHRSRISRASMVGSENWRHHSQWILLEREAASLVLAPDITIAFESVEAADEHYFGTLLSMKGFPASRVNSTDCTWVDWHGGRPRLVHEVDSWTAENLSSFPGFFARKFAPNSDIAKFGMHRQR